MKKIGMSAMNLLRSIPTKNGQINVSPFYTLKDGDKPC